MTQRAETIAARSADVILGPNPIVGLRVRDLAVAGLRALGLALRYPRSTARAVTGFGRELAGIARGESQLKAPPKDRRFADKTWTENRSYNAWLQSYLALDKTLQGWLKDQEQLGPLGRARLEFFFQFMADALAPSNFPWQPEARRRFRETKGDSARQGIVNFVSDLLNNRGLPAQVDKTPFKVGGNLANTEGAVILRTELIELIQYKPRTPGVHERPVLVVPPQINKFYIFDLAPEKSVARGLLDAGLQVFVISWRNPTAEQRDWGLAEYTAAIDTAVSAICALTGQTRLNLVGACAGGLTLASYVAMRAAAGDTRVNTLTMLVNVLDLSTAGDTPLGLFATPAAIESAKRYSARKGVLDGKDLSTAFAWLRPNDLVWSYWVNNVLLGNKPPAYDILFWNNDSTRLPARLHGEFLDVYRTNAMTRPGTLRLHGLPVDLGRIRCDSYLIAGTTDHITPWKACYASTQLFKGKNTFVLSNSGHIQSILNPPGNKKSEFWTGAGTGPDPEAWRVSAEHHAGSWWPHWHAWLRERSGPEQPAPARLGSDDYPELAAAPGTYVHE